MKELMILFRHDDDSYGGLLFQHPSDRLERMRAAIHRAIETDNAVSDVGGWDEGVVSHGFRDMLDAANAVSDMSRKRR